MLVQGWLLRIPLAGTGMQGRVCARPGLDWRRIRELVGWHLLSTAGSAASMPPFFPGRTWTGISLTSTLAPARCLALPRPSSLAARSISN